MTLKSIVSGTLQILCINDNLSKCGASNELLQCTDIL